MANFDVQIQALAGTATQTEMDDWATDGVKEIINILPYELKIECAAITSLTSSTPMDLDITGEVFHVTRENADAGYHTPCRKIPSMYGGLAEDSGNLMYYATATDPVYWTESDTGSDPKLFVKPTPTANQPARVHHVAFPSVDVSAVSAIVNFPNEAEYLVVLYASVKVLQNKMNEMHASIPVNSDQDGTFTTSNTSGENQGWEQVRHYIENEEDSELARVNIQSLGAEMQQFMSEYDWYKGQQLKLQQDYDKGLQMLIASNMPVQNTQKQAE
tara:strand:- start:25118 stop:25936 length:819 start_codon:yes stop_codon:yes gene_type:complete